MKKYKNFLFVRKKKKKKLRKISNKLAETKWNKNQMEEKKIIDKLTF